MDSFLIVFMETGLVITFLPGDSLLFAAGALAATSSLNIWITYFLLLFAAILGDTANYWIGNFIGPKLLDAQGNFSKENRFVKKKHFDDAHSFYEKYGGKAIVLAPFVPIIRTFALLLQELPNDLSIFLLTILSAQLWVSFCLGRLFLRKFAICELIFTMSSLLLLFFH